ncbi:MAG TPA: dihydroorotate dehydrogenase electron transfer subunit, partial [Bacillota bacterium]|nr:dihydroorotate dehydrogenase electron transfer subunit [Bacillota bacterium]
MVELAKSIRERLSADGQIRLIAAVGYQEAPFLNRELESFCDAVFLAVEKAGPGFRGNVLEMMEARGIEADYYLSCGPKPMLKALAELCARRNKPLQVSLEERMGCGYGACVGCVCKTRETDGGVEKMKQKKVCKDGPVFFGSEVVWDD